MKWLGFFVENLKDNVGDYATIDLPDYFMAHGVCQKCGSSLDINSKYLPAYCPHCGEHLGVTNGTD